MVNTIEQFFASEKTLRIVRATSAFGALISLGGLATAADPLTKLQFLLQFAAMMTFTITYSIKNRQIGAIFNVRAGLSLAGTGFLASSMLLDRNAILFILGVAFGVLFAVFVGIVLTLETIYQMEQSREPGAARRRRANTRGLVSFCVMLLPRQERQDVECDLLDDAKDLRRKHATESRIRAHILLQWTQAVWRLHGTAILKFVGLMTLIRKLFSGG